MSRAYRGLGIARALLALAFTGGAYDDRIVYATGYTWCWDLEGSGLSAAAYRARLLALFKPFGFGEQATDEPNSHWAALEASAYGATRVNRR